MELDVYQRLIYFQQVAKAGNRPFSNLVVNNKVDIRATKQYFR